MYWLDPHTLILHSMDVKGRIARRSSSARCMILLLWELQRRKDSSYRLNSALRCWAKAWVKLSPPVLWSVCVLSTRNTPPLTCNTVTLRDVPPSLYTRTWLLKQGRRTLLGVDTFRYRNESTVIRAHQLQNQRTSFLKNNPVLCYRPTEQQQARGSASVHGSLQLQLPPCTEQWWDFAQRFHK